MSPQPQKNQSVILKVVMNKTFEISPLHQLGQAVTLQAEDLFGSANHITIMHHGEAYLLSKTRHHKLLLTKPTDAKPADIVTANATQQPWTASSLKLPAQAAAAAESQLFKCCKKVSHG